LTFPRGVLILIDSMKLDLLILGDMHYVGPDGSARPLPDRKGKYALELAVRAVRNALRAGRPDAILLIGDILEQGSAPGAMEDARCVRETLAAFGIPLVVVPGNHDDYPDRIQEIFGWPEGAYEINGHLLMPFCDEYDPNTDLPSRPAGSMKRLTELAGSGKPIVVIQHPVILPHIEDDYPYNLANAREIADAYAEDGVCLSISGHFHAGVETLESAGTRYVVAPVLCQAPFPYTRIRLEDGKVISTETKSLYLRDGARLFDAHMHTEFAHCADDITVTAALERMALFGLRSAGFVEHSDQLYLPREGFWDRKDADQRATLVQADRDGSSRYAAFRAALQPVRSDRIFLGLEVESTADDGGLAVLEKDAAGYDYLVGSVHQLGEKTEPDMPQAEAERRFMLRTRQAVEGGVQVLAHPFRYFKKKWDRPAPRALYEAIADLLADGQVAAEINYHNNEPDPEFFALCLQKGVRLSFGSDAHALFEVADLHPHLQLLDELGVSGRFEEVLWRPARADRKDLP